MGTIVFLMMICLEASGQFNELSTKSDFAQGNFDDEGDGSRSIYSAMGCNAPPGRERVCGFGCIEACVSAFIVITAFVLTTVVIFLLGNVLWGGSLLSLPLPETVNIGMEESDRWSPSYLEEEKGMQVAISKSLNEQPAEKDNSFDALLQEHARSWLCNGEYEDHIAS